MVPHYKVFTELPTRVPHYKGSRCATVTQLVPFRRPGSPRGPFRGLVSPWDCGTGLFSPPWSHITRVWLLLPLLHNGSPSGDLGPHGALLGDWCPLEIVEQGCSPHHGPTLQGSDILPTRVSHHKGLVKILISKDSTLRPVRFWVLRSSSISVPHFTPYWLGAPVKDQMIDEYGCNVHVPHRNFFSSII